MVYGINAIKEKQTFLYINTGIYNSIYSKFVPFNTLYYKNSHSLSENFTIFPVESSPSLTIFYYLLIAPVYKYCILTFTQFNSFISGSLYIF